MGTPRHKVQRFAVAFLCLFALMTSACLLTGQPSHAWAEDTATADSQYSAQTPTERKTVKVAWFDQQGYQQTEADGTRHGYNFDYLQMLSQYTGWDYEFVDVSGFSEGYDMVVSGDIDLIGCVFYNDERDAQVDFPDLDMGTACTSLYTTEGSHIATGDFKSFDGIRVGVDTDENAARLQSYADNNGFAVDIVYFESSAEVRQAVLSGEIDAGVQSGYQDDTTTRSIAVFDPAPFYLVSSKSNPTLISSLNAGLS